MLYTQAGLTLEDLLHRFVCCEVVDAVQCKSCSKSEWTSSRKSKFIKRLTLGKVRKKRPLVEFSSQEIWGNVKKDLRWYLIIKLVSFLKNVVSEKREFRNSHLKPLYLFFNFSSSSGVVCSKQLDYHGSRLFPVERLPHTFCISQFCPFFDVIHPHCSWSWSSSSSFSIVFSFWQSLYSIFSYYMPKVCHFFLDEN